MRDTFRPKPDKHLTKEQKWDTIESLMFLKVKRDRIVKGQTCVDGWEQRKKSVTGDATPHTVYRESVLIREKIVTHEGCEIGICDIPGAFLSADMDENVKMGMRGRLVELMVNIAPQIYRQHVIYKKAKPFLFVTLKKVLYG